MAAVQRITQETFEQVVTENILEFEMEFEEAISDAVEQFKSQGVELSNILTDFVAPVERGGPFTHPVLVSLSNVQQAYSSIDNSAASISSLVEHLESLTTQCGKSLAHRCFLALQGNALSILIDICKSCSKQDDTTPMEVDVQTSTDHTAFPLPESVLIAGLRAVVALTEGQPDHLTPNLMEYYSHLAESESARVATLGVCLIRLSCVMHEANRQAYVENGIIAHLAELLKKQQQLRLSGGKSSNSLVKEVCQCLRSLTLDDDVRVPFGKSHEHAKRIVLEANALDLLLQVCQDYLTKDQALLGELLSTIGVLAVRNEFCQRILDLGGVKLMLESLEHNMSNKMIANQILGVLRAVARNDEVKRVSVLQGGARLIANAMHTHPSSSPIAENGCACLTALALRSSQNAAEMLAAHAHETVVQCMKVHADKPAVQKQACMALRNIVARCPENCTAVLAAGAEETVRRAATVHAAICADEAKAALRDLGCKVTLEERWKGEKGSLER